MKSTAGASFYCAPRWCRARRNQALYGSPAVSWRVRWGAREGEPRAEERRVACGHALGGLGDRSSAGQLPRHGVAQELRVEHLLGVVPLVERLGLVEALVAL